VNLSFIVKHISAPTGLSLEESVDCVLGRLLRQVVTVGCTQAGIAFAEGHAMPEGQQLAVERVGLRRQG